MFPTKTEFFHQPPPGFNKDETLKALHAVLEEARQQNGSQQSITLRVEKIRKILPDAPLGGLDKGGPVWNLIKKELGDLGWTMTFHEGHMGSSDLVTFE